MILRRLLVYLILASSILTQTSNANNLSKFDLDQRLAILSFLANGQIPDLKGMTAENWYSRQNALIRNFTFKRSDGSEVTIAEPAQYDQFSDLGHDLLEERQLISGQALPEILGYIGVKRAPELPDSSRLDVAHRLYAIVETAESLPSVNSERMRLLAGYAFFEPLARLYFRTGDTKTLRLLSWLMVRNPSIRGWVIHSSAENKNCLNFFMNCYTEVDSSFDVTELTRRQSLFALALLGALTFDPLGWTPSLIGAPLTTDQRHLLGFLTFNQVKGFLYGVNKEIELAKRWLPEISPIYQEISPLLIDAVVMSARPAFQNQPQYTLLSEVPKIAEQLDKIRKALEDDPYFRDHIGPPGPLIKTGVCDRLFLVRGRTLRSDFHK